MIRIYKLSMLLLAACLLPCVVVAQPIVKLWDKTIGGNAFDANIANMIITPSKKIMVACISSSDAGFDKTASRKDTLYCSNGCVGTWIFTLDKYGHKLWDQTYGGFLGGTIHTTVFGLVQQSANSFMLGCNINPVDSSGDLTDPYIYPGWAGGAGIWILNIDSLGNKLWNKRYFAQNMGFYFHDMILNDDNIYISCGIASIGAQPQYGNFFIPACYQGPFVDPNSVVFKIDTRNKAFKWSFFFHNGIGNSLFKNKSNNLIMGGSSDSVLVCNKTMGSHGLTDYGLVSTDTLGNIQWQTNLGGNSIDDLTDVISTNDGGYLLYGATSSPQGFDISQTTINDTSLWVVKIDSAGTKLWDKRFGSCTGTTIKNTNSYGKRTTNHLAISTSDDGFLLATSIKGPACGDVTESARSSFLDYWVIKIDQNGIKQWDKRFGCLGRNYVESLAEIDTGIYIVGGSVYSSVVGSNNSGIGGDKTEASRGNADTWFVCFADTTTANLTSITEITQKQITLSIWPNPANDDLNFELTGNEKIKNITLSNMLGEKVMEVNLPTSKAIQINTLQAGVYIFNCETTKGKRYVKKVMVTK